jgi:hypothetical protein
MKFQQNITLVFQFTLRKSFVWGLLYVSKLMLPYTIFSFFSNIDFKSWVAVLQSLILYVLSQLTVISFDQNINYQNKLLFT